MKIIYAFSFIIIFFCTVYAQEQKTVPFIFPNGGQIIEQYDNIEIPKFPGGYDKFKEEIKKNIIYPEEAQKKGIQGKVSFRFTIEKDGTMSNIEIIKDIGYGCGEQVLNALKQINDKWRPAKSKGKPVIYKARDHVTFRLQ